MLQWQSRSEDENNEEAARGRQSLSPSVPPLSLTRSIHACCVRREKNWKKSAEIAVARFLKISNREWL